MRTLVRHFVLYNPSNLGLIDVYLGLDWGYEFKGKNITQPSILLMIIVQWGTCNEHNLSVIDIPLFWIKVMFARFFHCNCTVPPFSYFGRELWRPMGSWRVGNYLYQNDSCIFILYFGLCCKIFSSFDLWRLVEGELPCLPDLSLSSCFWHFLTFCTISSPDSFAFSLFQL